MEFKKEGEKKILCEIDTDDLWENGLEFNDLISGGEKARNFLTEIVRMAQEEIGVNMENMPLMVKAVPVSAGKLELHISGVDKESSFMNRIEKLLSDMSVSKKHMEEIQDKSMVSIEDNMCFLYFGNLEQIETYAKRVYQEFSLYSTLYKGEDGYYLVLYNEVMSRKDFQRLKMLSSDYATVMNGDKAIVSYYEEHYEKLIQSAAITTLAAIV